MARMTLPQQRAIETRQRILEAATNVFARRGYGQATVSEIAAEAGISMGALYHHFPSKEDLYRALLDDHLRSELAEWSELRPAASLREAVEQFVAFQSRHLQSHIEAGPLSMEWAAVATEDWARGPVSEFHRRLRQAVSGVVRIAQQAGVVRPDLDPDAAALLMIATFEGLAVMEAVEPGSVDLQQLSGPWTDLIERFVQGEGEADFATLQRQVGQLLADLREQPAAPEESEA